MRVGRMRLAPQAVDDPQINTCDRCEGGIVEFGDVGRVCEAADPQAESHSEAMILRKRDYRNTGNLEWTADLVRLQGGLVVMARLPQRLEDIAEAAVDLRQGLCVGKERDRSSHQSID